MRQGLRQAKAICGRVVSRRLMIILAVLSIAVVALFVGGIRGRRAQAAPATAPQATQTPTPTQTPGPTPNYSGVDDILGGRRELMRVDDLIFAGSFGIDENTTAYAGAILDTENSAVKSVEVFDPLYDLTVADQSNPNLVRARMFDLGYDVVVSAYQTNVSNGTLKYVIQPGDIASGALPNDAPIKTYPGRFLTAADDFNGDGFDDVVLTWGGQMSILTAVDPKTPSQGLKYGYTLYLIDTADALAIAVGNFTGDRPEIAVLVSGAGGTGLAIQFYRVEQDFEILRSGTLTLNLPEGNVTPTVAESLVSGRFNSVTHDQLALVYGTPSTATLISVDFDANGVAVQKAADKNSYQSPNALWLRTGRFDWGSTFDQVAFLIATDGSGASAKILGFDQNLNFVDASNSVPVGGDQCIYDMQVGNFDRTQPDPNKQGSTIRNPNLQLAFVTAESCNLEKLNVAIWDVNVGESQLTLVPDTNIYALPSFEPNATSAFISLAAGDTQGRSYILGEPTKFVIDSSIQPTAVIAAPPMHIDFTTASGASQPSLLNLSAVPSAFFTTYSVDNSGVTQSSTTNTTSWSFGAKESISAGFEIGSVDDGDGVKASDTFTAAQALKGSTENAYGTYQGQSFDISLNTSLADQVWYSETRFNIYVYPVLNKTVCPTAKPNCQDSEKVPLTIQFSGPDQIKSTDVQGSQIEWYQPPWEYGNIFSYPGSYGQLLSTYPGINKLSSDLTWQTDGSPEVRKTTWQNNADQGTSTSFEQNYSFENDISVQSATGFPVISTERTSFDLDLSGSFGFSNLKKSSTTMSASTGIAVTKPGTFLNPSLYAYNVTPYIFGQTAPAGFSDFGALPGGDASLATFGLLQTAFSVDMTGDDTGNWWGRSYRNAPDIALNHPKRWVDDKGLSLLSPIPPNCLATNTGVMECLRPNKFSPADPWVSESQHMRGLFISSSNNPGQGPQLEMATAGDKLTLQARVYNYSLTPVEDGSKVHVRIYGQVWDDSNNSPENGGDAFLIGQEIVLGDPIPPFSTDPDAPLNWRLVSTELDTTPYANESLVFWVVVWLQKADGMLGQEVAGHGLTAIPGTLKNFVDAPIETSTFPDGNGVPQPVSYSNNVGFYNKSFAIVAPPSNPGSAVRAPENQPGDVRLGQVKVSERKITRGQSTEVSLLLRTRARSASGVSVVFYDGDPDKGGKIFDVERIGHLRARDAYEVRVPFRSNDCGEHQIFVNVGGAKPYEVTDSSRTIQVQCAPPPTCATVCLRAPQYYLNNLWSSLPRGEVWVAGTEAPISTRNVYAISQALRGGNSALRSFNREYVAAQLSVLSANLVGQRRREALASTLACYGVSGADAVTLSNGAIIGPQTTWRELLAQAEWVARAGRAADREKMAGVLGRLNSDDPTGACPGASQPARESGLGLGLGLGLVGRRD